MPARLANALFPFRTMVQPWRRSASRLATFVNGWQGLFESSRTDLIFHTYGLSGTCSAVLDVASVGRALRNFQVEKCVLCGVGCCLSRSSSAHFPGREVCTLRCGRLPQSAELCALQWVVLSLARDGGRRITVCVHRWPARELEF